MAFDCLVLLQYGGRLAYWGPLGAEAAQLVAYLQGLPGVAPLRPGFNPATWFAGRQGPGPLAWRGGRPQRGV